MAWLDRMNDAIRYIEDHLKGDIDYEQAAKIAGCPHYHFQRMFALIAEVSVSQYVRRRRLTLAAFELQHSSKSVIEIALEYGYESHSAFTRAFHEFHGLSPIAARKSGAKLKACSRMSFHNAVAGGAEMDYRVERIGPFAVVGFKYRVRHEQAMTAVPAIWQNSRGNGVSETLCGLLAGHTDGLLNGVLGILAGGDWGRKDEFSYYAAAPCEQDTMLAGMETLRFPESSWLVFTAHNLMDIAKAWRRLYSEFIPLSMYALADLPAIECYYSPGHNPQNELWIPIVMTSGS